MAEPTKAPDSRAGDAKSPAAPPAYSPYTGPSEIVEGGRYIQGATLKGDKLYGGRIVDAHGTVLAVFDDKHENTGNPDDGKKPPKDEA
jgi:hypothetical protein